ARRPQHHRAGGLRQADHRRPAHRELPADRRGLRGGRRRRAGGRDRPGHSGRVRARVDPPAPRRGGGAGSGRQGATDFTNESRRDPLHGRGDPRTDAVIGKDEKLKRALAWLPAKLYELAVRLRVAAYETDYRRPRRLGATVIAIGNLTLGGTGKTPLVEYVARYLHSEAHRVAILTRGYGRESAGMKTLNAPAPPGEPASTPSYREVGDEPLMLARALPTVPIVIHKNRF